ncbi:hypothetical protein EJB05_20180, partial [Eragrostis curvula]
MFLPFFLQLRQVLMKCTTEEASTIVSLTGKDLISRYMFKLCMFCLGLSAMLVGGKRWKGARVQGSKMALVNANFAWADLCQNTMIGLDDKRTSPLRFYMDKYNIESQYSSRKRRRAKGAPQLLVGQKRGVAEKRRNREKLPLDQETGRVPLTLNMYPSSTAERGNRLIAFDSVHEAKAAGGRP